LLPHWHDVLECQAQTPALLVPVTRARRAGNVILILFPNGTQRRFPENTDEYRTKTFSLFYDQRGKWTFTWKGTSATAANPMGYDDFYSLCDGETVGGHIEFPMRDGSVGHAKLLFA
jgi:hypothetical protein